MAESKVVIKIGAIEFSGEGDPAWIEKQLDKVIEKASDLIRAMPGEPSANLGGMTPTLGVAKKPLGSFLREKGALENQNKRFLAVAVWLEAKGKNRLETSDITKTLRENNQSRLGN